MAKDTKHSSNDGTVKRSITRADVRSATMDGVRMAKSDPRSVRLTAGQRKHITKG